MLFDQIPDRFAFAFHSMESMQTIDSEAETKNVTQTSKECFFIFGGGHRRSVDNMLCFPYIEPNKNRHTTNQKSNEQKKKNKKLSVGSEKVRNFT